MACPCPIRAVAYLLKSTGSFGIGDPLSAARASYRKAAKCVPNSPDKTAKHPHCTVKVAAGVLEITGDPITRMALSRRGSA